MESLTTSQAYLEKYSPEAYMQFYHAMGKDLFFFANPARVIPISHMPLVLEPRYQQHFSGLVDLFWRIIGHRTFQRLSAENIPEPLCDPALKVTGTKPKIPFDPGQNIGCIDLHLTPDGIQVIEYMVLPPGMVGIYPSMLARYGAYLESLLPGCGVFCFEHGWDHERCEDMMLSHISGPDEPEGVAIIDWEPKNQVTYGEFCYLLNRLQKKKGIKGIIADPREISVQGGKIMAKGMVLDRIFNRLTLPDWLHQAHLIEPYTRLLWEAPEVFVYHPYLWYLGDKASLTLLSDPAVAGRLDLTAPDKDQLASLIPSTQRLSLFYDPHSGSIDISRLIDYFGSPADIVLKPISSHASKGIIFGPVETPTLRALEKVLERIDPYDYVAMRYAPVPEIAVPRGGGIKERWKCDFRIFVLNGKYIFPGGRVYFGDYTNQLPCRGFAPLFFD